MSDYHEPVDELSAETKNISKALSSLKEEIEAINWYNQRVDVCKDDELKQILIHNRDEEIEHACMALEWLRKNMSDWDENLRTYLFSDKPVTELEEGSNENKEQTSGHSTSLNIGNLKE